MFKFVVLGSVLAFGLAVNAWAAPANTPGLTTVDWPTFLAKSDLVWEILPARWDGGAFIGNGMLGGMIYVDQGELSWELGRVDVVDDQPSDSPMVAAPRLPLGFLRWRGCQSEVGTMRLDLWNAEATGKLMPGQGPPTDFRSWTHADESLIGIAVAKGGCTGRFEIDPAAAISDRAKSSRRGAGQPVANPPVESLSRQGRNYALQRLTRGRAHVIATDTLDTGTELITFATVVQEKTPQQALAKADRTLAKAKRLGWNELTRTHRKFWHTYYPQSFVSLPDSTLESFYWIQMYKLASATRAAGPVIDTLGPWYHKTPWPGVWWNLNVQLSYWPAYTSNRLSLAESLINGLRGARRQLRDNASPHAGMAIGRTSGQDLRSPLYIVDAVRAEAAGAPLEHGNLLWALHNVWMHYLHSADERLHRDVVGLLSESVAYYLDILARGDDGRLHLPIAISPEYPVAAADTNYDLALLIWGLRTLLLPENQRLVTAQARQRWTETLGQLPDFAVDNSGVMVGKNTPLAQSHRHFSHLLMFYPLALLSPDVPAERDLLTRSLAHWIGKEGALEGYSFVGASAMEARLGHGDAAFVHLAELVRRFVRRNTMYMEAGPVIETPLAAAQAVHEMLLQSRDNAVFVFPALPTTWLDVAFFDLRAVGAFNISAERHAGRTTIVKVHSLAGRPLRLHLPPGSHLKLSGLHASRFKQHSAEVFDLRLRAGETVTFLDESPQVDSPKVSGTQNPFGSRAKNAWLSPAITSHKSSAAQNSRPSTITKDGVITTWELLNVSVPTVFSDNGAEEVYWQHTSCDPCMSESTTATPVGTAAWKSISTSDGCFDFHKLLPKSSPKDSIAYLRATVVSETERTAQLRVGLNDQGRVWWWSNGAQPTGSLHVNTGGKTLGVNEVRVPVQIKKGTNHVFVKTINQAGAWAACVSL